MELLELKKREKCEFDWEKFGFEIADYENVNSEKALNDFREFAPDLMISIRFGQIFKPPLIAIARLGALNLHSGILPKYRGILATFWAILNGEKNIGMTFHYIRDAGIDTGDVIGFYEQEIDYNSSLLSNIKTLYRGGYKLLVDALEKISREEKIVTIEQSKFGEGKYFSYPQSVEIKKFVELMPLF